MEEPLEEQLKPAKKQLRSAKVACEEAHTVETNAKSFIESNNENEVRGSMTERQNKAFCVSRASSRAHR